MTFYEDVVSKSIDYFVLAVRYCDDTITEAKICKVENGSLGLGAIEVSTRGNLIDLLAGYGLDKQMVIYALFIKDGVNEIGQKVNIVKTQKRRIYLRIDADEVQGDYFGELPRYY